jgi:DNA-binding transcriptional MerR regulator
MMNNRQYREYDHADVAELETIARLRKLFFTLDEIRDMKQQPERLGEILEAYQLKLRSDVEAKARIVQALAHTDITRLTGVDDLALALGEVAEGLPLPERDIKPDFGRFDPESKEEREQLVKDFEARQRRQFQLGRLIVFGIAGLNVLFVLIGSYFQLNLISILLNIAVSIALCFGVSWVRYLFIFSSALNVLRGLALLIGAAAELTLPVGLFIAALLAYNVASCILLIKNQAVSDFLYAQKHG